jgi:hypothetical protein
MIQWNYRAFSNNVSNKGGINTAKIFYTVNK